MILLSPNKSWLSPFGSKSEYRYAQVDTRFKLWIQDPTREHESSVRYRRLFPPLPIVWPPRATHGKSEFETYQHPPCGGSLPPTLWEHTRQSSYLHSANRNHAVPCNRNQQRAAGSFGKMGRQQLPVGTIGRSCPYGTVSSARCGINLSVRLDCHVSMCRSACVE